MRFIVLIFRAYFFVPKMKKVFMTEEENKTNKNFSVKSTERFKSFFQSSHKQILIFILLVFFLGKIGYAYIKSDTVKTKTNNIQKGTNIDMKTNKKDILNISNLPIVKYIDCIESGIYKISDRNVSREFTHVVSLSPKEFIFINGYYHYGANNVGVSGAKQEKINQIEKYDISNNYYSKILDLPKAKIRMDKIPLNEKDILLRDGSTLYLYNVHKNKLDIICDSFDYFLLFPYNKNEFLLNKNNNLYVLNTQTKKIKFIKKATISLDYPIFKIDNDLVIVSSSNSGKTNYYIYSIEQNQVYDKLNISTINTVEKISDNTLLIIETITPEQGIELKKIGEFKYNVHLYDIKNKKFSKTIILKENGTFREKYQLKKLSNGNFLLYTTSSVLKIFNANKLEFQNLEHEYWLNNDGIEQIININEHQILINTKKNIYIYQY